MSVPEVQRKCVAGVRTTAHGPDQNNVEPVEHVGSREQIGAGLSQPGTAARDSERISIHAATGDQTYQSEGIAAPSTLACEKYCLA